MHLAAVCNRDTLKLLIEKLDTTAITLFTEKNRDGNTALHFAAKWNKESLELLIEKFLKSLKVCLVKKNAVDNTPLHLAIGNKGAFKLLIEKFPEQVKNLFDVENQFGDTVLQYANSRCPDALPKEYKNTKHSCVILGNKDCVTIPGLPEAFSSYYQDQVALLLKLRLEDAKPGALKSVNVLEENYTLREGNEDYITAKLSSFIIASEKDTILMPLNIGGSHLVGIAAVKDGNKVVLNYMDSEQGLPPESLIMKIGAILESYGYSTELRIVEVEEQKYSNCGPVENLTAFITEKPRVSQEEAILKHSMVFERHLLKDSDYESIEVAIQSAMLNEKLLAQVQHYIRTGEAFDSTRSAIEDSTVSITRQSSVMSDEEVANTIPLLPNEESYNDSSEVLYPTAEFSPDYSYSSNSRIAL